jgi:GDP-L-fucose synthase
MVASMKVLLTGGAGMMGQAIQRLAPSLAPSWSIHAPTRQALNLQDRLAVATYMQKNSFDLVVHAAAKVGGIKANMADPVGFMADNMAINLNVIEEARKSGVPKFIFMGSSCMYPRNHRNPLVEDDILQAPLEPTNEGYALSKIAGTRLCDYISAQYGLAYKTFIPCNLYGLNDHFDPINGHLVSAVILKIHTAMENGDTNVEIWGDGTARREFMFVDDIAEFILTCPNRLADMPACLNTGLGIDYSVNDYYQNIAGIVGYQGTFTHNLNAPTGMQQKLMDSSKAKPYGWNPKTSLLDGLKQTYDYFLKHKGISG